MTTLSSPRPHRESVPGQPLAARAVDGLGAVSAEEWDGLVGAGSGPLTHGYLTAWEHAELAGLCSCPVVASAPDSGKLLAACPGYMYDLDMVGVRVPAAASMMSAVRRLLPGLLVARTYELGSPTPLTNPFLVCDPDLRGAAVRALIAAALDHAEDSAAEFLLVQNFTSRNGPAGEQLADLGFGGVPMPYTAVVDLPYRSFEEYLNAMRAQYRRRARQVLKRSDELSVEHREQFGELAGELAALWRLVYERACEVKREILTPAYFRATSELEASSVLLTRRPDGSIASFALLLGDRPWLAFLQCGFDAEAGRTEGAYFRLLYEIVRLAIEQGFEQVELGMTTLEPKLDVGAIPVPLFAWVKHRNPLLRRVVRAMADGPMSPDEVEPRKVFKDAPPTAAELVSRRGLLV